jgi:large subunit ribosomal protein L14
MIFINTILGIADNTGGKIASCIRITKRLKAKFKDKILVSLKRVRPNLKLRKLKKKLEKGQLWLGLIIKDRNPLIRIGGHFLRFSKTGIILMKTGQEMAGSRIYGPICKEIYFKKYFCICSTLV